MKDVLIIIPAFNEEASIIPVLKSLKKARIDQWADCIIIDDGSTDRTRSIALYEGFRVISLVVNRGYGSAIQLGYKYAIHQGYHYVIQLDADGQHDLSNLEVIYQQLKTPSDRGYPDIVIGSRFLSEASTFKPGKLKQVVIKGFSQVIYGLSKVKITDPTSGLQGLNAKTFSYYAQFGNFDYRYPDLNMIIQMLLLDYRVVEVPAIMHNREAGTSMHAGLLRQVKYMTIMVLSTLTVILRQKLKQRKGG